MVKNVQGGARNERDMVKNVQGDARNERDMVKNVQGDARNVIPLIVYWSLYWSLCKVPIILVRFQ